MFTAILTVKMIQGSWWAHERRMGGDLAHGPGLTGHLPAFEGMAYDINIDIIAVKLVRRAS